MDHEKKIYQSILEGLERDLQPQKLALDATKIMKVSLVRTDTKTGNVSFSPTRGWFSREKKETIGGFTSKLFDMSGFEYEIYKRKKKGSELNSETAPPTEIKLPAYYFKRGTSDPKGKGYGLLYDHETVTKSGNSFKGTLWLSSEFPRTVKELMPIFEVLAPTHKHFAKLKNFIELKLPDEGFPVKIDVPIVPTVSAVVTFLNYSEQTSEENLFQLGSYTKGKVQFLFHFSK